MAAASLRSRSERRLPRRSRNGEGGPVAASYDSAGRVRLPMPGGVAAMPVHATSMGRCMARGRGEGRRARRSERARRSAAVYDGITTACCIPAISETIAYAAVEIGGVDATVKYFVVAAAARLVRESRHCEQQGCGDDAARSAHAGFTFCDPRLEAYHPQPYLANRALRQSCHRAWRGTGRAEPHSRNRVLHHTRRGLRTETTPCPP
jgi:hypothetical protein